jgi:hypothetical protein
MNFRYPWLIETKAGNRHYTTFDKLQLFLSNFKIK